MSDDYEGSELYRAPRAPLIVSHEVGVNKVVWWTAALLITSNVAFLGSYILWQNGQLTTLVASQAGYQAGVTEKINAMDRRLANVERMLESIR